MTVKELMDQLGFPSGMGDLDEALKWALVELHLRREQMTPKPYQFVFETRCGDFLARELESAVPFGAAPPQFDDRF